MTDEGTLVPARESLEQQGRVNEVTPRMVEGLRGIGPGGLLVFDLDSRRFRLTHGNRIDLAEDTEVIVYGHGDLLCDEVFWDGVLSAADLATAIHETACDLLGEWTLSPALSRSVRDLRGAMANRGFRLNGRPDRLAIAGRPVVRDYYVFTDDPQMRVTVKAELDPRRLRRLLARLYDEQGFVRGRIIRFPVWWSGRYCATEIRDLVTAHTPALSGPHAAPGTPGRRV